MPLEEKAFHTACTREYRLRIGRYQFVRVFLADMPLLPVKRQTPIPPARVEYPVQDAVPEATERTGARSAAS